MEKNVPNFERDSFSERPVTAALSGCMYALFVIAASVAMLLTNALLCLTIYTAIPKPENEPLVARVGQLFYFIAPVLLMIVEWNLLDRLQRLFRSS